MIKILVRSLNWLVFWIKLVIFDKKQIVKNNISKSKLMHNFIYEYKARFLLANEQNFTII